MDRTTFYVPVEEGTVKRRTNKGWPAATEDPAQDAVARILANPGFFRGDGAFTAWAQSKSPDRRAVAG